MVSFAAPLSGFQMRLPPAAPASETSDQVPAIVDASDAYITISRAPTAMVSVFVATLPGHPASAAWTANVDVPATVGVPLMTPFVNVRPAGSEPLAIVHVVSPVPPVA